VIVCVCVCVIACVCACMCVCVHVCVCLCCHKTETENIKSDVENLQRMKRLSSKLAAFLGDAHDPAGEDTDALSGTSSQEVRPECIKMVSIVNVRLSTVNV
jgi:hypothetical protein